MFYLELHYLSGAVFLSLSDTQQAGMANFV